MSLEESKRDPIIKSLFDEGGIEQPSGDFTSSIIKSIREQSESSVYTYKPVISRTAWLAIAFVGIALFIYVSFGMSPEGQGLEFYGYSLKLDTSFITGFFSKIAISFTLSPILKTSLIALVFFTFFNLIVFEIKNRSFFK